MQEKLHMRQSGHLLSDCILHQLYIFLAVANEDLVINDENGALQKSVFF